MFVRNSFLSEALSDIMFKLFVFILSVIWWRDKEFVELHLRSLHLPSWPELYLANSHLMNTFHGGRSRKLTQRKSHNSAMLLSPGLPLRWIGSVFLHLLVYMLTIQIMNKDRETECSFICEPPEICVHFAYRRSSILCVRWAVTPCNRSFDVRLWTG